MNMYEMEVFFDNGTVHREIVSENIKAYFVADGMHRAPYKSVSNECDILFFDLRKTTHITFYLIGTDEEKAAEATVESEQEDA